MKFHIFAFRLSSHGTRASTEMVILFLLSWRRRSVNLYKMDLGEKYNSFGIELLTQSNYKIWRTCMASHVVVETCRKLSVAMT